MIFIDTKTTNIFYHFAAEYYYAKTLAAKEDVFLLWRTTPTLVIGRNQNALEEIDAEYAREMGITVARRMSGGGTMFIDEGGWQFTFLTQKSTDGIDFERFVTPIVDALSGLGIHATLSGRNDITIDGRKISGNSQYRVGETTVHHGTLLFDSNIESLVRATTPKEYKITSKAIRSVRERVTNIREHLPTDMTSDEFRRYLIHQLTDAEHEITAAEHEELLKIAAEKFADPKIIFAASPKFEMEKDIHLEGGTFTVGLSVKNGVITDAGIKGDFFSETNEDPAGALIGVEYTPDAVQKALSRFEGKFFRAPIHELVRGLFE